MSTTAVSILIPVYNRSKMLRRAVESALAQNFSDFDVVIVDNASTDDTWDVCQEFASRDSRVQIHRNDENIGMVRNSARCFELAKGRLGKVLYSDDTMYPDFLEKTVPLLNDSKTGLVFTDYVVASSPEERKARPVVSPPIEMIHSGNYIDILCLSWGYPVSPGAALFRMEDLRRSILVGLQTPTIKDFDIHGAGPDLLLYLRTAHRYERVAYVREPLNFFLYHKDSSSGSFPQDSLYNAYFQCKVLFAKESENQKLYNALVAWKWLKECKKKKRLIDPSKVVAEILDQPPTTGIGEIMMGLLHKARVRMAIKGR